MIAVFLKNKLVTCDTIMPVILAVKRIAPGKVVRFYTGDWRTYAAIMDNTFLHDSIQTVGTLHCFSRPPGKNWWLHRLWAFFWLLSLSLRGLCRNAQFVHFQALNQWPFRMLAILSLGNVFLFESTCWHQHVFEGRADSHKRDRRPPLPFTQNQIHIGFNEEWGGFKASCRKGILMPPSRELEVWRDHVSRAADQWFCDEFKGADIEETDKIIVYILGTFGKLDFMRPDASTEQLVRETLTVLCETAGDYTIFIKPHVITDRLILDGILDEFPGASFIVTGLHPTLLANRAHVFISNYYSTTQADATSMGVPTIEFSDYADSYLEVTDGRSMNPRYIKYFVNRSSAVFRDTLSQVLSNSHNGVPAPAKEDHSGVIYRLATGNWKAVEQQPTSNNSIEHTHGS